MCREEAASVRQQSVFYCWGPVGVWQHGICVERRWPVYGGGVCFIARGLSVFGSAGYVWRGGGQCMAVGDVFSAGSLLVCGGARCIVRSRPVHGGVSP